MKEQVNQVSPQVKEAAIFELVGRLSFENALLKGEIIRLQQALSTGSPVTAVSTVPDADSVV